MQSRFTVSRYLVIAAILAVVITICSALGGIVQNVGTDGPEKRAVGSLILLDSVTGNPVAGDSLYAYVMGPNNDSVWGEGPLWTGSLGTHWTTKVTRSIPTYHFSAFVPDIDGAGGIGTYRLILFVKKNLPFASQGGVFYFQSVAQSFSATLDNARFALQPVVAGRQLVMNSSGQATIDAASLAAVDASGFTTPGTLGFFWRIAGDTTLWYDGNQLKGQVDTLAAFLGMIPGVRSISKRNTTRDSLFVIVEPPTFPALDTIACILYIHLTGTPGGKPDSTRTVRW